MKPQPLPLRRPLKGVLLVAALLAVLALLIGCSNRTPSSVTEETLYVDSIALVHPLSVHQDLYRPIHRIYWSNGATTLSHGNRLKEGDSIVIITYSYK